MISRIRWIRSLDRSKTGACPRQNGRSVPRKVPREIPRGYLECDQGYESVESNESGRIVLGSTASSPQRSTFQIPNRFSVRRAPASSHFRGLALLEALHVSVGRADARFIVRLTPSA